MTRVTRKTQKILGEGATNNGVFGSLQASNPVMTNDVEQIQSLNAWNLGWNQATLTSEELPPLEEMQGVEYVITYQLAYLMQEGLPEWDSATTYYTGSMVKQISGTTIKIYCSLVDNNLNKAVTDTASWKVVYDSTKTYVDTTIGDTRYVTVTTDQTVTGMKTFTSEMVATDIIFDHGSIGGSDNLAIEGTGAVALSGSTMTVTADSITFTGTTQITGATSIDGHTNISGTDGEIDVNNGINISSSAINLKGGTVALTGTKTTAVTPASDSSSTDIATTAWVNSTSGARFVTLTGDQTVAGKKTFSDDMSLNGDLALNNNNITGVTRITGGTYLILGNGSAPYPTTTSPAATDNSERLATTAWVRLSGNGVVHTQYNETIAGTKTFSVSPTIPTIGISATSSTQAVNAAYITNKFKIVSSLPSSPDANTFYFIEES